MTRVHASPSLVASVEARPARSRAGVGVAATRAARLGWASLGLCCVGLGAVGVVVPGLPTTVFLMVACWAFARSCPPLERWVLNSRLFRPYAKYLDGSSPMPVRAKVISIALMWLSVGVSCWVIARSEAAPMWVIPVVALAAAAGSVYIARWRPRRRHAASS